MLSGDGFLIRVLSVFGGVMVLAAMSAFFAFVVGFVARVAVVAFGFGWNLVG